MEQLLEILKDFWFGPDIPGMHYGIAPLAAVGIQAATSLIGGIFGSRKAKKAARAAAARQAALEAELRRAENSRQAIINPYADNRSLASMAKDLSGGLSNPYANLGVATQAAELQVAEADISLANTLDTIRATGAGAGGATALAQAALKSKQGVAANIEQQEAANEKLRAQGQAELQQQRMAEQQRIQGIQISEGAREQQAQAQGRVFAFNAREEREVAKLNRLAAQVAGAEQQKISAKQQQAAAWSGAISGIGSAIGAGITGGAFKKG